MSNQSFLNDFITFKKFISTKLIMIIYALGAIYITISGISTIFRKRETFFGIRSGISDQVLLGLVILVLGNLVWRVICEGAIVLFGIHDSLTSIEKEIKKKNEITGTHGLNFAHQNNREKSIEMQKKRIEEREAELDKELKKKKDNDFLKY